LRDQPRQFRVARKLLGIRVLGGDDPFALCGML
jgi:hypothetical protein